MPLEPSGKSPVPKVWTTDAFLSQRMETRLIPVGYPSCTLLSSSAPTKRFLKDTVHAREYIELHTQVQVRACLTCNVWVLTTFQTSVGLLDSLESFLSTFQKDLTAVAGQISELQDRSQEIDTKLKSRRVSCLMVALAHPPPLLMPPWSRKLNDLFRASFLKLQFLRLLQPSF